MKTFMPFLVAVAVVTCGAFGQSIDGKTIELVTGEHFRMHVPVELDYEGPAPERTFYAVESATGKQMPAAVRDGKLSFVAEGGRPGTTHSYVLESATEKYPEVVQVTRRDAEDVLEVRIYDKLFTAYHFSNDHKKPFLWPMIASGDASVTRDWPMGQKAQTEDHPHHVSCWVAYGALNGVDCWAEGENSGFQHSGEVTWGSGDAYGWIKAVNVWQDKDHKPVIGEEREYRFYAAPEGARIFDAAVTFKADFGDVKWADTKEGGLMSVRMADALREKGGNGKITTSAGAIGAGQAWGKPAAWCDYSGQLPGMGAVGLTIFDHPRNLRHPTHWHVRDYGLMGANCFGYHDFTEGKENGDWEMKQGDVQTFRYRVYVHAGDATQARVADKYTDFATPPRVRWIK